MATLYYYTARSADGLFVRGSIEATTETTALASLRMRSLFVTSLQSSASPRGVFAAALQFGAVSKKDLVAFFRSFATLVAAGVSIRRALAVTHEQCASHRLREALASALNDVENGLPLSEALARHPKEFPRLFVTILKAGETGGILEDVLERLASLLERERAAVTRLASALTYPAVVASAAVALIVFLITSIVPAFSAMFEQMHVPVPWITAVLISFGTLLHRPESWIAIPAVMLCAVIFVIRMRGTEVGRSAFEAVAMRMPLIGAIMKKTAVAQLARMLGTLLGSGVGVIAALEVLSDVATISSYRRSIGAVRTALAEGASISEPLAYSGLYEPMFVHLVRVGEETGALDTMLLRIADYYDLDLEAMLSALGSTIEPLLILVLGGAVAFIAAAVFIPLYSLIGSIK